MFRAVALIGVLMIFPAVASAQQPCTSDARRVVDEVYRHMLERSAGQGSEGWVQRLSNGSMTVRDLVREVAKSPEHMQRFYNANENDAYRRAVETLYRHVLGRQADDGGAIYHAQMAASRGLAAVVDALVSSSEYQQRYGDWGVPGSGGVTFCAQQQQSQSTVPNDQVVRDGDVRFRGMDTNNDGRITRDEWRGTPESFRVHDWNRDGVLTGNEIRAGYRRNGRNANDERFDRDDQFQSLDANNNGRVEWREWHGTSDDFDYLDRNNDNSISRAEYDRYGADVVATSGTLVAVDPSQRWTDTRIDVRAGETVTFDSDGTVQLSTDPNDIADPGGSRLGRRASNAPLTRQLAGGLIARIGNSNVIFVGDRNSIGQIPVTGRLYLGVNDDFLRDNSGEFRVRIDVR